ncbi:Sodium:dicarboxylate symporter [Gonapodya prolifera JEL478]|uniref:Amino acid transporter n=1 Tax=Gonapodya prolifera (strain JEL478) TaxID=1344416 RepID=A0A139AXR5_GONPJ|nr:Sodium:dicarboxylate symporter [Gonapodya prolifera JEL478]|eukprot:KXS21541.1 Sodium:dicarboxylate symporter [Gonapodya prolifera JEL478]
MAPKIPDWIKKPVLFLWNLHQLWWILIGSLLGILLGFTAKGFSKDYLKLLSTGIFLPLVKLSIFPLIFSLLIVGIAGNSHDTATLARMGVKSISYFIIVTIIAIFIGLIWGNILHPGDGISIVGYAKPAEQTGLTLAKLLSNTIPESIILAGYNNASLQITFAATMFGVSMILLKKEDQGARKTLVAFFDAILKVMFKYIDLVMRFVPFAIFGALAGAVANNGASTLASLGKLIGCVYLGLFTFLFLVLIPIALVTKLPFLEFARKLYEPLVIAFSTASSDAALARAVENLVAFGVPKDIVGFVIPLGYSFNLDGTTLYLASAMLFCAQAGGVEMDLGTQIGHMFIIYLSSKGIAGVPRASLVILAAAVTQFGLPSEAVTIILGVDEIMDMARTAINVTGNMLACYVIAKWEGRFREPGWDSDDTSTLKADDDRDSEEIKKLHTDIDTPSSETVAIDVEGKLQTA